MAVEYGRWHRTLVTCGERRADAVGIDIAGQIGKRLCWQGQRVGRREVEVSIGYRQFIDINDRRDALTLSCSLIGKRRGGA